MAMRKLSERKDSVLAILSEDEYYSVKKVSMLCKLNWHTTFALLSMLLVEDKVDKVEHSRGILWKRKSDGVMF
jgi:hypothetical protein